jgi:hypothetical protein
MSNWGPSDTTNKLNHRETFNLTHILCDHTHAVDVFVERSKAGHLNFRNSRDTNCRSSYHSNNIRTTLLGGTLQALKPIDGVHALL